MFFIFLLKLPKYFYLSFLNKQIGCLALNKFNRFIFTLLIIFTLSSFGLEAKSRKEIKREKAINYIRENSDEIADLAGINNQDPVPEQENPFWNYGTMLGDGGEDLDELELEDDLQISEEVFFMMWTDFIDGNEENNDITDNGIEKSLMMESIMDWLGTKYRFGGDSRRSIDCSAFTRRIFRETMNIELPRTARIQYKIGDKINREDLQFGDLVYFKTRSYAAITHIGIYLADGIFVHAGRRDGVAFASLDNSYYKRKYRGARRLTPEDFSRLELSSNNTKPSNKN